MSQIDNNKVHNFRRLFKSTLNRREQKEFLLQELNLQRWVSERLNKSILEAAK